jgi:hypothetical protein
VERIFPVHSPTISGIEVVRRGHVRRAKLYYLRERRGKRARVKERRWWESGTAPGGTAKAAPAPATEPAAPVVDTPEDDQEPVAVEAGVDADAERADA